MENHGQKRSADEQVDVLDGVQVLLLDIEGTTTPNKYIKEKLSSYIRENAKSYLESHFDEEECQGVLDAFREQGAEIPASAEGNKTEVIEAAVTALNGILDAGNNPAGVKSLNGYMVREAYKTGLLQGEVYNDIVPALKTLIDKGTKVYTFSSSDVEGQKLLFGYSDKGNLAELFSGYFDTSVGAKDDKESYSKITEDIGVKADDVLYVTDLASEAKAAGEAGLRTVIISREDGTPLSEEDKQRFNTVESLTELTETSDCPEAKRTEVEDDDDDDDLDDDEVDDIDDLDGEVDDAGDDVEDDTA